MSGVPLSTVRLQLQPDFTLDDAAESVPYFASLGVSHLYLSPVLQAAPGSTHGYDVVDHTRIAADIGGDEAFSRLVARAHAHGLGIVVDVVPNHMTTPTPLRLNAALWSLLAQGRDSRYADWFDIDWDAADGRVLLPVLGDDLGQVLQRGELDLGTLDGEQVVRYFDHVFPVAAGTAEPGADLSDVLDRQHYVLADWRRGAHDLSYRRFFDVTSLIAVRVEEPAVFDATHDHLVHLVREGGIDGLRIDHPDGLADPRGYLDRLAQATDGAWVVVEKILEGAEQLPQDWRCAGTTGYDALLRIGGLFIDTEASGPLAEIAADLTGGTQDYEEMVLAAKRQILTSSLRPEVARLMRVLHRALPEIDGDDARRVLEALLTGMDRYRIYIDPDDETHPTTRQLAQLESALARSGDDGVDEDVAGQVIDLAAGQHPSADSAAQREFVTRFQQTCGPVMAKAVEDTTFYRYVRLTGQNEVGGHPAHLGTSPQELHEFFAGIQQRWPQTMTTLTTHDTKRSEDVRARLGVLSEAPRQWQQWLQTARELVDTGRPALLDGQTEYLLWQTLVGAWPISAERLEPYALKAVREAKQHTAWVDGDEAYEAAVGELVRTLCTSEPVARHVRSWLDTHADAERAAVLGQKLVQLTAPGVPDLYQGTEVRTLTLVDPDNREVVDFGDRAERLHRLDAGQEPGDVDEEKTRLVALALRMRRDHADAFGPDGRYLPLDSSTPHVFAFARAAAGGPAEVVTVVTRLSQRLAAAGGLREATVELPEGPWVEVQTGRRLAGGTMRAADLVGPDHLPVALLARPADDA